MSDYFKKIDKIKFEGKDSENPLSFKFYDENKIVLGKSMKEQLRFATCYWHTFTWPGLDPFGGPTLERPWMQKGDPIEVSNPNDCVICPVLLYVGKKDNICWYDIADEVILLQKGRY